MNKQRKFLSLKPWKLHSRVKNVPSMVHPQVASYPELGKSKKGEAMLQQHVFNDFQCRVVRAMCTILHYKNGLLMICMCWHRLDLRNSERKNQQSGGCFWSMLALWELTNDMSIAFSIFFACDHGAWWGTKLSTCMSIKHYKATTKNRKVDQHFDPTRAVDAFSARALHKSITLRWLDRAACQWWIHENNESPKTRVD